VTDGEDGFIVPVRDSAALAQRILTFHRDRQLLADSANRATESAKRFSLQSLSAHLDQVAESILNPGVAGMLH
jgi:glycosyltransferase involved in cell wall biosynthesis